MKRLLMLFGAVLAVLFTAPVTARAAQSTTLTVTADKTAANPGDKVSFTVNLGAVNNLGGMDFYLDIPAGLTVDYSTVNVPAEVKTALKMSETDASFPNKTNENLWSHTAGKEGYTGTADLELMTFTCTVDEDSALGIKSVGIKNQDLYDNTAEMATINTTVKAAELTVEKKNVSAQGTTLTVTADKAVANPGDKVSFTVTLGAVNNLGGMDFYLDIPAGLTVDYSTVNVPAEVKTALKMSETDASFPNKTNENLWSHTAGKEGYTGTADLKLMTFTCTVDEDSALGTKSVGIKNQDLYDNTADMATINTTVKAAELTVEKKDTPAVCEHSMTKVDAVAASCEKDGNVEYYSCSKCGKKFADAQGTKEVTDVILKAAGHTADAWKPSGDKHTQACTVCGKTLKEEAHVYDNEEDSVCDICGYQRFYQVIGGADASYDKESGSDLVIKADGSYALFEAVKVDGEVVSPENYTVAEGSTVVTLKKAYLDKLSAGEHKIEITYTDGKAAATQVKIQEKPAPTEKPEETEKPAPTEKPGETEKPAPTEKPDDASDESEESEEPEVSAGESTDAKPVKSPNTGENRSVGLMLAAMLAAGAAGVAVYRKSRKDGQDRKEP